MILGLPFHMRRHISSPLKQTIKQCRRILQLEIKSDNPGPTLTAARGFFLEFQGLQTLDGNDNPS